MWGGYGLGNTNSSASGTPWVKGGFQSVPDFMGPLDKFSEVPTGQFSNYSTEEPPEVPSHLPSSAFYGTALSTSDDDVEDDFSAEAASGSPDKPLNVGLVTDDATTAGVSPEMAARREVALAGGGLSGCTTVMVRHVPSKYTQRKLMRDINSLGFLGTYDFFFLPMDARSHSNRGFVFVNLLSPEAAEDFYKTFHNGRLPHFSSEKALAVLPADLQGFEENALRYASTTSQRGKRAGQTNPIFFRALPPNVLAMMGECRAQEPDARSPHANAALQTQRFMMQQRQSDAMQAHREQYLGVGLMPPTFSARPPMSTASKASSSASPAVPHNFCVFCGTKRIPHYVFCPNCGARFTA